MWQPQERARPQALSTATVLKQKGVVPRMFSYSSRNSSHTLCT